MLEKKHPVKLEMLGLDKWIMYLMCDLRNQKLSGNMVPCVQVIPHDYHSTDTWQCANRELHITLFDSHHSSLQ